LSTQPTRLAWGPLTSIGLIAALITLVLDQASKLWLIFIFGLGDKGIVRAAPFVDLVLTWNTGISYGLFQSEGSFARWFWLAVKMGAVIVLWFWLARVHWRTTAMALGLLIGGALGNAVDRFTYGAVADFVLFHIETADWRLNWYVFNLADAAIVAGVAMLLYESLFISRAAKAP
jgi:signal peptidase II